MKRGLLFVLVACRAHFDPVAGDGGPIGPDGGFSPTHETYIKASDARQYVQFGYSAALSNDGLTFVVGAPNASESYVFVQTGMTWSEQAILRPAIVGGQYGYSIAVSADGNTVAVGDIMESSNATGIDGNAANTSAPSAGAVYVLTRAGTTWTQQAYVKASNTEASDYFGATVALSGDGNTLAVGAVLEDSSATGIGGAQADNLAVDSGAVYLFTRAGATWSQQAYIKASNTDPGDNFGNALALSTDGNVLAVSAPNEASAATGVGGNQADNSSAQAGAVYVFRRASTVWSQDAYVKESNTGNDMFGIGVALSGDGNLLAVGAALESSAATGVGGDQLDNSAGASGAVYVFDHAATWTQQAYIKSSNTDSGDWFGNSVAVSVDGHTLAVGAVREASAAAGIDADQTDNSALTSGAAYVFTRAGSAWSQEAYIKASNPDAMDRFGQAVCLSFDGSVLAVTAHHEASAATGIDGNGLDNSAGDSGAAYVVQ
jgi:hypothetical protein